MTYANISKDAQKGDAKARYELAVMYHRGMGVPRDLKQAARWYRMAAEQGLLKAQVQLASMYAQGEGLAVQLDKAAYWYEKAAEQGEKEAQRQLAEMYADGAGVEADLEKSLAWSELAGPVNHAEVAESFRNIARESNSGRLQFQLARMLDSGRLPGSAEEPIEWYQRSADTGHLESMLSLALRLAEPGSDPDSRKRSHEYLIKAKECGLSEADWELGVQKYEEDPNPDNLNYVVANAELGHLRSQLIAAKAQFRGELTDYDSEWALQMMRAAAERGLVEAQFSVAAKLMEGSFVEQGEALRWLYQAARAGHLDSQYMLGVCHIVGQIEREQWLDTAAKAGHADAQLSLAEIYVIEGKRHEAFTLLRIAAADGHSEAQFRLALLLLEEPHPPWEELRSWLYRSAEAGHGGACLRLHEMHLDGHGVDIDQRSAINWLMRSAEAGVIEAFYRLACLTDEQLQVSDEIIYRQEMLQRASDGGHPAARFELAKSMMDSEPSGDPSEAALELMHLSANDGYLEAADWLANYYVGREQKEEAIPYLEMCLISGRGDSAFILANILTERLKSEYDPLIEEKIVECLQFACESGAGEACFQLAVMTARGEGTHEDYTEAFHLFSMAAEDDMKEAQFRVGVMLLSGLGCEVDHDRGEMWLSKAADGGHVEAAVALAQICEQSESPSVRQRAIELFQFAAHAGHLNAIAKLAKATTNMEVIPADLSSWGDALVLNASCGEAQADLCLRGLFDLSPDSYINTDIAVYWYRIGSDLRNADAQFWLAECYLLGIGLESDVEKAHKLYALAAHNGNASAQLQLGDNFYFGEGVDRDSSKAAELYEAAAVQGNTKAQFNLASMCELGEDIPEDRERAIDLYRRAAENDHGFAQLALSRMLMEGGDSEDFQSEAVMWLERAAELELPDAVFSLGHLYLTGAGSVAKDYIKGLKYINRAVEMEHIEAKVVLAKAIIDDTMATDFARALSLLKDAERAGSLEAVWHLGSAYLKGLGVGGTQDFDTALTYLSKAADAGHPQAQLNLGLMYLNGVGVAEDSEMSAYWMEQAALQGVGEAQYLIGLMYLEGAGRSKDEATALTWFQEAAHSGHAAACYMLARAYTMGIGLEVDSDSAISWCRKAADQGHHEAAQLLSTLT